MGQRELHISGKGNLSTNPRKRYDNRLEPGRLDFRTKASLAFSAVFTAAWALFGQPTAPIPSVEHAGESPASHGVSQSQSAQNQLTVKLYTTPTLSVGKSDVSPPMGATDVISPTVEIYPSPAVSVHTPVGRCTGSVVGLYTRAQPPKVLIATASHCLPGEINTAGGADEWIGVSGAVEYNPTGDLDQPGTITLSVDAMKRDPNGAGSLDCYNRSQSGGLCYDRDFGFVIASGRDAGSIPVQSVDQNPVTAGTIVTMTGFGGLRRAGTITMTYGATGFGGAYSCISDSGPSAVTRGDSGSGVHGPKGLFGVHSAAFGTGIYADRQEIMRYPICALAGGGNTTFVRDVRQAFGTGTITTTAIYTPAGVQGPWIQQDGFTVSVMGSLPPGTKNVVMRMEIPHIQTNGCVVTGMPVGEGTEVKNFTVTNGGLVTDTITVAGDPKRGMRFRVVGGPQCPEVVSSERTELAAQYFDSNATLRFHTGQPVRIAKPDSSSTFLSMIAKLAPTNDPLGWISTGTDPGLP